MARKSRWIATVAVAVSLFCAASAQAEPVTQTSSPNGTEILHEAMKNYSAVATFVSSDATGCILSTTTVFGTTSLSQTTGAPVPNDDLAVAIITRYDQCRGVYLFLGAIAGQQNPKVTIQPSLGAASTQFDTTLKNQLDGQLYTLHVGVTFTARSSTRVVTFNNTPTFLPGVTVLQTGHARLRDAVASGNIVLGSTNLAPGPTTDANILNSSDLLLGVFRS